MKLLTLLFPTRSSPKGVSEDLQAAAIGVPPALRDAIPAGVPSPVAAVPERGAIVAQDGRAALVAVLAEKVLHGWLQNQHQTLFPLTVNLRTLQVAQRETLMRFMAVALLATHVAANDDGHQAPLRKWLVSAGADEATIATLDAALSAPPVLNLIVGDIIAHDIAAYAYVMALMALDPRDLAGMHFLDYAAARLGLPNTVVQSARRRYRR